MKTGAKLENGAKIKKRREIRKWREIGLFEDVHDIRSVKEAVLFQDRKESDMKFPPTSLSRSLFRKKKKFLVNPLLRNWLVGVIT